MERESHALIYAADGPTVSFDGRRVAGPSLRARRQRQLELEVEARPLAGRGVDAELAAHPAHELAADRQRQPRARERELPGLHPATECIEERRQHLGGNPP